MSQSSSKRWDAATAALVRWRWGMLIFTAVASLALVWPASQLKLDESVESFYDPSDPQLQAYLESKSIFLGDEFVMVAYQADHPTSEEELRQLAAFSDRLSRVPGVRADSTQDLADSLRNSRATGRIRVLLRLPATQREIVNLSRHILIGEDNRTLTIVLRLADEETSPVPRTETYRRIREIAQDFPRRTYVAGEPLQIHDMFRYVEEDSWVLGLASSMLLMTVILFFFRNVRWVILPILVIQITLLWTKGILSLTGIRLSMVSSMLTSLVTVIAIATVTHITVMFREYRVHWPREQAFCKTFSTLAEPTFWISLTTAIGFASLLISETTPVRSFALMMALGSMLVPLVCLLILPGGILIGHVQADPREPWGEKWLISQLQRLAAWSADHPWPILGATVALTIFSCIGVGLLKVETDFSKNFRASSPIVHALNFFEANMGGVGSWEIGFPAPSELTEEELDKVRALAQELNAIQLSNGIRLTKVLALTDGLDLVKRIPRYRNADLEEQQMVLAQLQPEMQPTLYNPERGRMRIVLRALEQQPSEVKLQLIQQVEETARKYFPEAKATGLYVLLAHLITSLLGDQLTSFLISCAGMLLCLALAFRGFWIGLISLVPNVLPIILVVGCMGWFGMPINIGTAMIASVSIGLTVDTTILYLAEYERARRGGATHQEAVNVANGGAGLALTLANVALIAGFSVLALSNFVPLIYFGVLVSLTMLGGLIGNLVLLPVMLKYINRDAPPAPAEPAAVVVE
ncbi:efflux RND transporter permease subunit [Planctomicrobium sp. SH664]|uniref:efflux RND transporter permease subunit n=1 Tax=Planctomicrobium sp. SH664 TaxID=3448125 RepID=UPI003F5ADE21